MVNPAIEDKRQYWRVRPRPGDQWAVFESRAEALEYVGVDGPHEIEERWMTPREFSKLKEHVGWW